MTTIPEQNEAEATDAELGQYFDFRNASGTIIEPSSTQQPAQAHDYRCPSHSGAGTSTDCLCHGFLDDWGVTETPAEENPDQLDAAAYARFQDWIPRFVQPVEPCEYCRDKRLNCYMSFGKVTCSTCDTLFRPCSFAHVNSSDREVGHAVKNSGFVDTLHHVQEDVCQEQGSQTGLKSLRSKAALDGSKKTAARFSRAAVKVLRDWLDVHHEYPYPTDDEKTELERETGLKSVQISTWLANARRRSKLGQKKNSRSSSPSLGRSTNAINIPAGGSVTPWGDLNPFERWKHSPPENEPAPMTAIADAVASSDFLNDDSPRSSTLGYRAVGSSSGSVSAARRAPSTTSLETGRTSSLSANSSAAWSGSHESNGSFGSFGSGLHGKRDRKKRRRPPIAAVFKKPSDQDRKRIFQCTFCTDTFKSKYDWSRHEKSLHLSLEKWICAPLGPVTTDPKTGDSVCVYCRETNPSPSHSESHGHRPCENKGMEARTFYRKDHLRQHLRIMHNCELLPEMESWKSTAAYIKSRCGFCQSRFNTWQERVDHLAAHFKEGMQMTSWKGCRGLEPPVAAHVINAMPPYLIGSESKSPVPFSATGEMTFSAMGSILNEHESINNDTQKHRNPSKATCWEVLTIALGRYVKEQRDDGITITDEMLQSKARHILYSEDDPWNQTCADNPEWLDLFKKAHGLDYIPTAIGGIGSNVPEDLELYGDLGMRIPFSVQLKQGMIDFDKCPEGAKDLLNRYMADRNGELRRSEKERQRRILPYSQLPIPADRAVTFSTLALPTYTSGVIGPQISTADWHLVNLDADMPSPWPPTSTTEVDPTLSAFSATPSSEPKTNPIASDQQMSHIIIGPDMTSQEMQALQDHQDPLAMPMLGNGGWDMFGGQEGMGEQNTFDQSDHNIIPQMLQGNGSDVMDTTMDMTAIEDFDFDQINFDFSVAAGEKAGDGFHV